MLTGSREEHRNQAVMMWSHALARGGEVIVRSGSGDCDEAMDAYGEMMMDYGRHEVHALHSGEGIDADKRAGRRNAIATAVRSLNRCRSKAWKVPSGRGRW